MALIATEATIIAIPTARPTTTAAVATLSTPRPAETRTSLTALPSNRSYRQGIVVLSLVCARTLICVSLAAGFARF